MPRLKDTVTGSTVNVSEATAKELGDRYVPVEPEPAPKKPGRPRKK